MTRTVVALVVLALLAAVAGGAQCVVRCASPVTPPPCHHHSPAKQSPPAHACAAEMLPGEARFDVVPTVVAVGAAMAAPESMAVATVELTPRVSEHPAPPGRAILRI